MVILFNVYCIGIYAVISAGCLFEVYTFLILRQPVLSLYDAATLLSSTCDDISKVVATLTVK